MTVRVIAVANPRFEGTADKQGLSAVPAGFAPGRPLKLDVGQHEDDHMELLQ